MLTIGHVLIALAHAPIAGGIGPAFEWGFITDVIAVGLLIGPLLIDRVRPGHRLALAGAAYALTWIGVATWRPESAALERAKEYLLGPSHFLGGNPRLVFECFPLIPWLAVYVAATVLGEYLGRRAADGTRRRDHADAEACGGRLRARRRSSSRVFRSRSRRRGWLDTGVLVWTLGWPLQKQPPRPPICGVYAALGLLLLCGLLAARRAPSASPWLVVPAALGRASLAMFIAQYYLYFTVLAWWNPGYSPALAAAPAGIARSWWSGSECSGPGCGNNDLFTVGYRWLAAVRSTAASARF